MDWFSLCINFCDMCYQQKCFRSKILESVQVECNVIFIQVISTSFLIHKSLVHNQKCMQSRRYRPTGGDAQIWSMDFSDSWDGDNLVLVETLFLFGFTSSVTMGWSIFLYCLISKIEKQLMHLKTMGQAFPGGAVVKTPSCNAGDMGSNSSAGRFHMPWSN